MSQADDIFEAGRQYLARAKKEIVATVARDAVQRISATSNGQLTPVVRETDAGAVVVIPFAPDSKEGKQALIVEKKTGAFEKTAEDFRNPATLVQVLNTKG